METSRENCQKIRAKHHRKIRAQDKNFPALFVLLYNLDLFARGLYYFICRQERALKRL
jgi:hypothetical protein